MVVAEAAEVAAKTTPNAIVTAMMNRVILLLMSGPPLVFNRYWLSRPCLAGGSLTFAWAASVRPQATRCLLRAMVSARLDPELVATLRDFAARHGMSLSDVLREAAVQLLARETAANVITFGITVTNGTRPGTISRESYHREIPAAI